MEEFAGNIDKVYSDTAETIPAPVKKQLRGFALLSDEQRLIVSAKGGKRAHELGKAYKFSPEVARSAGRKGGIVCAEKKRNNSKSNETK